MNLAPLGAGRQPPRPLDAAVVAIMPIPERVAMPALRALGFTTLEAQQALRDGVLDGMVRRRVTPTGLILTNAECER